MKDAAPAWRLVVSLFAACGLMVGDSYGKERGWGQLRRGERSCCSPLPFCWRWLAAARGWGCSWLCISGESIRRPRFGTHWSCAVAVGELELLSQSRCRLWLVRWGRSSSSTSSLPCLRPLRYSLRSPLFRFLCSVGVLLPLY